MATIPVWDTLGHHVQKFKTLRPCTSSFSVCSRNGFQNMSRSSSSEYSRANATNSSCHCVCGACQTLSEDFTALDPHSRAREEVLLLSLFSLRGPETLPHSYTVSKWQRGDMSPTFLPSQTLYEPYYVTRTVTGSKEKEVGLGRTCLEGSPGRKMGHSSSERHVPGQTYGRSSECTDQEQDSEGTRWGGWILSHEWEKGSQKSQWAPVCAHS